MCSRQMEEDVGVQKHRANCPRELCPQSIVGWSWRAGVKGEKEQELRRPGYQVTEPGMSSGENLNCANSA